MKIENRKSPRAFTLIELLVVIAIIALLVSILLPSLSRAKELAKRSVCSSGLRNIGTAMVMYAEDNEEKYPPYTTTHWPNGDFSYDIGDPGNMYSPGFLVLEPNYVSASSVFFCPSQYRTAEIHWPSGTPRYTAGYCYWANYISGPLTEDIIATTLSSAPDTVMVSDTMVRDDYPSWSAHSENGQFAGGNILFNDSHVEWRGEGQTEEWRVPFGHPLAIDFWF